MSLQTIKNILKKNKYWKSIYLYFFFNSFISHNLKWCYEYRLLTKIINKKAFFKLSFPIKFKSAWYNHILIRGPNTFTVQLYFKCDDSHVLFYSKEHLWTASGNGTRRALTDKGLEHILLGEWTERNCPSRAIPLFRPPIVGNMVRSVA